MALCASIYHQAQSIGHNADTDTDAYTAYAVAVAIARFQSETLWHA